MASRETEPIPVEFASASSSRRFDGDTLLTFVDDDGDDVALLVGPPDVAELQRMLSGWHPDGEHLCECEDCGRVWNETVNAECPRCWARRRGSA